MVLIHIKRGDQSQFLYEINKDVIVDEAIKDICAIYNGRLKIERVCCEIEELAEYGTMFPPEILGLTEEQVAELKLVDQWGEKCIPSGGFNFVKDPVGRRNGKQPNQKMQEVLKNTVKEAREKISKKLVSQEECLTLKTIHQTIELLKGAVTIVYPMKLPPHDVIRMEFENVEDLSGTQASLEVIDPVIAQLWFCGRELIREKNIGHYTGKNNKCKVIIKLSKKGEGAPAREPVMSEEERKQLMLHAYKKQEEFKKLEKDDDDSYLNSEWADNELMKRTCQGIKNISFRPK